jgi:uncharacterized protein involved in exopolysaccharide biosynthesis
MSFAPSFVAVPVPAGSHFQLADLLRIVHRRRALIRNVAAATVALAIAVVAILPTRYSSSASLMLDSRKNNVTDISAVLSQLPTDPSSIQNQIQILTSRELASHVIAKLRLYDDPEFNPSLKPGAVGSFVKALDPRSWFARDKPDGSAGARDAIVDNFLKHVSVDSQGLSTTLTVTFTARDPARAAFIANALVDTYIEDQVDAKRAIGNRTTAWLLTRTQQLADQVQADEAAVQRYKAENNLNETSDGTSFADQQISAISNQLVLAKADLAQKQATNDRVTALIKAGDTADVSQILASPLIVQLRTQQAALIAQESDLSTRYGPLHPKMVAIQTQKKDLQDKIATEVSRLAGSISNDVVVARAQVGSLQASLAQAEKQAAAQNLVRVKLKALEANAQSTRTMYEAFVTRLRETQDQDVIQNPDAHVISRAPVPSAPSSPKRMLIVGASIPAGLLLGLLAALLAERFAAPAPVPVSPAQAFRSAPAAARRHPPVLAQIRGLCDARAATAVLDLPGSPFAQAIGRLLTTLRRASAGGTVVCVTSPDRAGQGFLAAALARAASRSGLRVAVIDADLQQPALAQILGVAPAEAGLVELLSGSASGAQAFRRDPRSRAQMIAPLRPASDAERILASARLADFLARLRKSFDIVVVNAPPLASGAGVSSLHGLSSALVVVGRAGSLGEPACSRAIAALQKRRGAAIGLVVAG